MSFLKTQTVIHSNKNIERYLVEKQIADTWRTIFKTDSLAKARMVYAVLSEKNPLNNYRVSMVENCRKIVAKKTKNN